MKIELPWPPSLNNYRAVVRGRLVTSKKGKAYKKEVYYLLHGLTPIQGRLGVIMELHPPSLRGYDIDNFCKAVFDAITESGLWEDDERIDVLSIIKREKVKVGKVVLDITANEESV